MLGKSPAWQDADGACSGYLVEEGDACVLVDCGNGVFSKLRAARDYSVVDTVVISHLHADHFMDLIPYAYALSYSPHPCAQAGRRPLLYAPPGGREAFRQVTGAWSAPELIENAFEVREYDPADTLGLGPLHVAFREVPHFVRAYAIRVTGPDGNFTFSADCAPNAALPELARDTDLLLIEAALELPELKPPRGHLTPSEAGEHGQLAGARRLVLTHISNDIDPDWARAEAERTFGAPVEIAREGATYDV